MFLPGFVDQFQQAGRAQFAAGFSFFMTLVERDENRLALPLRVRAMFGRVDVNLDGILSVLAVQF